MSIQKPAIPLRKQKAPPVESSTTEQLASTWTASSDAVESQVDADLHAELAQDLKNLIDIIWTHANHVQGDLADTGAPLNPALTVIQRACQRAWELTDAVKTRNLDGACFATFDLNERIQALLPLLNMALPHYVTLDCQPSHHPLIIHALPDHLDRLVINLVLNARDAIGTQGIIRLSMASELRDGLSPSACLRIADTGHGLAPQMLDHLGRPFITPEPCGLGPELGLASLKAMLTRMKGNLAVEHRPGRGSAYTLRFPLLP